MVHLVVMLHYYTVDSLFYFSMHDVGNCNLGKCSAVSQRSVREFIPD